MVRYKRVRCDCTGRFRAHRLQTPAESECIVSNEAASDFRGALNAPSESRDTGGEEEARGRDEWRRVEIFWAPPETHWSNVWRYFGFLKKDGQMDKTHAVCKQCRAAIKYVSSATNMETHESKWMEGSFLCAESVTCCYYLLFAHFNAGKCCNINRQMTLY